MLLALLVRSKRKRPGEVSYASRSSLTPPILTDDDIKDMVKMSEGETKKAKKAKEDEMEEYDPASAGAADLEDEVTHGRYQQMTRNDLICMIC